MPWLLGGSAGSRRLARQFTPGEDSPGRFHCSELGLMRKHQPRALPRFLTRPGVVFFRVSGGEKNIKTNKAKAEQNFGDFWPSGSCFGTLKGTRGALPEPERWLVMAGRNLSPARGDKNRASAPRGCTPSCTEHHTGIHGQIVAACKAETQPQVFAASDNQLAGIFPPQHPTALPRPLLALTPCHPDPTAMWDLARGPRQAGRRAWKAAGTLL